MARLDFFFSTYFWEASSSVPVMKMLAQQAVDNIKYAVSEEVIKNISFESEFEEEIYDEFGNCIGTRMRDLYSCGSCVGYDPEVNSEYKSLITQLTRRSAYLTIFGIFEHRIIGCLKLMEELTGVHIKKRYTIEECHSFLKKEIGVAKIKDVDHLTVIRNIMAHSDGIAENYQKIINSKAKRTDSERRLVQALRRGKNAGYGISVTEYNNVIMDESFLDYAISEFERYFKQLEDAVRTYYENSKLQQD